MTSDTMTSDATVVDYLAHCPGLGKKVADVMGFLILTASTALIGYKNVTYKGPSGNERYFNGFKEENMLSFFVNLFAAVSYFARIIADASCSSGFAVFTTIKYCDYLSTCPLLVLDLMWNLEAPYKWSCAAMILVTLVHGVAATNTAPPESYCWFTGGVVVFAFAYVSLILIVKERIQHFTTCATTNQAMEAIFFLKFACWCFFGIWVWYPLLWILSHSGVGLISHDLNDILHMLLDVCAKSVYGLVLLKFRTSYDKKLLKREHEDEFLEFSKTNPARRTFMAVTIQGDDHVAVNLDALKQEQSSPDSSQGLFSTSVSRQAAKQMSVCTQPDHLSPGLGLRGMEKDSIATPKMVPRLMFFSNERRNSLVEPSYADVPKAWQLPTIPSQSQEMYGDSCVGLHELSRYLKDQQFTNPRMAADTIQKLENAGVTEEQLRTCVTDGDLKELQIGLGARRAIIARYGRHNTDFMIDRSHASGTEGNIGLDNDEVTSPALGHPAMLLATSGMQDMTGSNGSSSSAANPYSCRAGRIATSLTTRAMHLP